MAIICSQCGYENSDGDTICEMCAEPLGVSMQQVQTAQATVQAVQPTIQQPIRQQISVTAAQNAETDDDGYEYFVICPESNTKTILPSKSVSSFFCAGCQREHVIDEFIWSIDKKEKTERRAPENVNVLVCQNSPAGDHLFLIEVVSQTRIDIDKAGGYLGRYGKYGANFFVSRGYGTVSGEHCLITNEFGYWVLRHTSKTNDTLYDNMLLVHGEPHLLEDGKILTLSNAVSFVVHIG